MQIAHSVALVTGANRGLGRHFAEGLLERGATKVYATARRPETVDLPGAQVLRLDVTDSVSIAEAARVATDVSVLINNAGIATGASLVTGDFDDIQREMDTHYYGPLRMIRAFAPILREQGGGAIANVLSVAAWLSGAQAGSYYTAKAAAWSLTNSVRLELGPQNTLVTGVVLGPTDTEMAAGADIPKNDPVMVVRDVLDAIEGGYPEVLVDEYSATAKAALSEGRVYGPKSRQ